jgi:hypothetical protein
MEYVCVTTELTRWSYVEQDILSMEYGCPSATQEISAFKEPEDSLPCLKQTVLGSYPESVGSSQHPHNQFL